MASTPCAKRPREEISEERITDPGDFKIDCKHEEEEEKNEVAEEEEDEEEGEEIEEKDDGFLSEGEEEEEDTGKLLTEFEKMVSVYCKVDPTVKPLEDGWESDGGSCFPGRYVRRSGVPCLVSIFDDIIENRDQIKDLLTYRQELIQSQGFNFKTVPPPRYDFIRHLNYDNEDECVKESVKQHALLAIDAYNKKHGDERNLEFVGIERINVSEQWDFVFYITLRAREWPSGEAKLYQTRIYSSHGKYVRRPLPFMVRVDVFRPFQMPKTELANSWHFFRTSGPRREHDLRGMIFQGTIEEALDHLGVGKP